MKTLLPHSALLAALVMGGTAPASAEANRATAPSYPQSTSTASETGYSWRDGANQRPLWLDQNVIAQLPSGNARLDALPPVLAGATPLHSDSGLKVWKLPTGLKANTVLASLSAAQQRRFAPVLRDGSGPLANWRVAAPQLIVFLPAALNTAEAQAILQRLDLRDAEALPYRANGYRVLLPVAGLSALALANRIAEDAAVQAAFPQWLAPGQVQ